MAVVKFENFRYDKKMIEKWSEELTTMFLKKYRTKECLWNVFCPEYRNQQMRIAAYEELVKEMKLPNFSVERAKNKIKNLRSTYTQELKKMETSNGSYVTSLVWFDEINSFIRPMVGVRSSNHNPALKTGTPPNSVETKPVITSGPIASLVCIPQTVNKNRETTVTTTDNGSYHFWNNTINALTVTTAGTVVKPLQSIQPTPTVCLPEPLFVTVQTHNEVIEVDPMIHTDDEDEPNWQIENIRSERRNSMSDNDSTNGDNEADDDDNKMSKPPKIRRLSDSMQDDPLPMSNVQIVEDEFDAFGRSVALQLKRMSLHCALNAQIKIQTVLTEMRLSEVEDHGSDVSNSETSH